MQEDKEIPIPNTETEIMNNERDSNLSMFTEDGDENKITESFVAKTDGKIDMELGFKTLMKETLKVGLPSAFSVGDYYALLMIIKLLLSSFEKVNLLAASAYFTGYYSLLLHAINLGLVETQGILGSQAFGRRDFSKVNLYLRQAFVIDTLVFGLFTVAPAFFIADGLEYLGVAHDSTENIGIICQQMVLWSLPGMYLRMINDSVKVFIQNQGEGLIRDLGLKNMYLLLCFIPISYALIGIYGLEISSLGIIIFLYEFCASFILLHFVFKRINPATRDTSIPVTEGLKFFAWESTKNFITDYPGFLAVDTENIIVGKTNSKAQLAIHTLFFNIGSAIFTFFIGFLVGMRTRINQMVGRGENRKALKVFKRFEILTVSLVVIIFVILCFVHWGLSYFNLYGNEQVGIWAHRAFIPYFINSAATGLIAIYNNIMRTIKKQNLLVKIQFSHFGELLISYYLSITLGFGVAGVGIALVVRQFILVGIQRIICVNFDWDSLREYGSTEMAKTEGKDNEMVHDSIDEDTEVNDL